MSFKKSRDILTTPQRHQQQARQAFRELALNVEESPRRRPPAPRPETPTPQPRYIERIRTAGRASNRMLRDTDLLGSLRRRHLNPQQDENLQPVASTSRAVNRQPVTSASRDVRDEAFMYNPLSSYDTPCAGPSCQDSTISCQGPRTVLRIDSSASSARSNAQQARQERERQESTAQENSSLANAPSASTRPALATLPNFRSLGQQHRRARERQERLGAQQIQQATPPFTQTLPQANEVAVACQNIGGPLQNLQPASATNARSLGQQRRRAREREARSQRTAQGQERVAPAHQQNNRTQNNAQLQTPPTTQTIQPAGQDDAHEEARRLFNLYNAFADANGLYRRPGR
ncbi:hypothetical protein BDZ97DRAFT_1751665 [Flammula alnicola]|nr:hypothetical protein BDZ97DRAFT_1751665 [Flammula alnicola]